MKKIIFILFIFVFISFSAISTNASYVPSSFEEEIKAYISYDPKKLNLYYQAYLESSNIILALNTINYPNFFDTSKKHIAFKINNQYFVNKTFYLKENFVPENLVPVTKNKITRKNEIMLLDKVALLNFEMFINDYFSQNNNLLIFSAYRSFHTQKKNYSSSLDKTYVAKAGHSEHQTGMAIDISTKYYGLTNHFEYSSEFEIIKNNIYKYGFILRYPSDKVEITGYPYEPWHFRYVGRDIAKIIYLNNLTLEEYVFQYVEIT